MYMMTVQQYLTKTSGITIGFAYYFRRKYFVVCFGGGGEELCRTKYITVRFRLTTTEYIYNLYRPIHIHWSY